MLFLISIMCVEKIFICYNKYDNFSINKCGACAKISCEKSQRAKKIIATKKVLKEILAELLYGMDGSVYVNNNTVDIKDGLLREIQALVV